MMSVVMLSVVMLNVAMLSVIMLSVVMLGIMVPWDRLVYLSDKLVRSKWRITDVEWNVGDGSQKSKAT